MFKKLIIMLLTSMVMVTRNYCMEEQQLYTAPLSSLGADLSYTESECNEKGAELIEALEDANYDDALELIAKGANVNYTNDLGQKPLIILCDADFKDEDAALEVLSQLINNGAIMDEPDNYGTTPLMFALSHDSIKMCNYLINANANVLIRDNHRRTCLIYYTRSLEMFQTLLDKGVDINAHDSHKQTSLMCAVANASLETVKFLIERGANIMAKDVMDHDLVWFAIQNQDRDVENYVRNMLYPIPLRYDKKRKAIDAAKPQKAFKQLKPTYASPNLNKMQNLLVDEDEAHSFESDALGLDLLEHLDKFNDNLEAPARFVVKAKKLIENGANVNIQDEDNMTPLIVVCSTEWNYNTEKYAVELAQALVNKKAKTNHQFINEVTPLMLALSVSESTLLPKFLIEQNADVTLKDTLGRTSLIYYCTNPEIAALLVENGANPQDVDKNGTNGLMYAAKNNNSGMMQFFLKQGVSITAKDNRGNSWLNYTTSNLLIPQNCYTRMNLDSNSTTINSILLALSVVSQEYEHKGTQNNPEKECQPRLAFTNPLLEDTSSRCFINAIVQCLLHLNKSTQLLTSKANYYHPQSFAYEYVETLRCLTRFQNNTLVDLTDFCINAWLTLGAPIGTQQDASEFLNHLLDRLSDLDIPEEIRNGLPCYESTEIPMTDFSKLFYFTIESKITSSQSEPSRIKEYYTMLNLPLNEDCRTLDDCLKSYFSKEELEQEHVDQTAKEKQLSLLQPAPYMIMRLKRDKFGWDEKSVNQKFIATKNNTALKFPLELSLIHKKADSEEETVSDYKLQSFIAHEGTIGTGHYTAFVNINDEWYKFDDGKTPLCISQESISDIADQGYCENREITPTLFFYGQK